MPGGDRGLGRHALWEQDAGCVEKGLPGNAQLPAVEGDDELAVQPRTVAVKGGTQDDAKHVGHRSTADPRPARAAIKSA